MTVTTFPSLGFGTAAIALGPDVEAMKTIDIALEAGIQYFDTAPLYGGGQAEVRLGRALKGMPDIIVSTKCGRFRQFGAPAQAGTSHADVWDFSEQSVRESIERSCERLDRNYLNVVFLHDIEAKQDQAFHEALPVLRELQSAGRIGAVGTGCNTVVGLLSAVDAGAADVLLIAGRWTLLDRTAGAELLPAAANAGVSVVAGGVLNSGCLACPEMPGAKFNYRTIQSEERAMLDKLVAVAVQFNVSLTAAALQFPQRETRVSTSLLGASGSVQLQSTLDALREPIPDGFWKAVEHMGLRA